MKKKEIKKGDGQKRQDRFGTENVASVKEIELTRKFCLKKKEKVN
jgi:hypothetical protein